MENPYSGLPGLLLPWYASHRRDLPWRRDRDAYHVWLSEIMLQQTRVEAVKGYYARFLEACPTVEALAHCDDEVLHKLWEGLGYYSRVRNLKKAALVIMQNHDGVFPSDYDSVRALPGIGDYTAGAICSICYGLPTPAVDGNVLRVAARITQYAQPVDTPAYKAQLRQQLAAIYPADAGSFTQGLMELGATVCIPNGAPKCEVCPCRAICQGYAGGTAATLPVKLPKKEKKQEDRTVFILSCGERYAVEKRPAKGLLAGLWQFPNLSGKLELAQALEAVGAMGLQPINVLRQVERSHIFTHIRWDMRGFYLEVAQPGGSFVWMTGEEISRDAALPTAFRQFWEELSHV